MPLIHGLIIQVSIWKFNYFVRVITYPNCLRQAIQRRGIIVSITWMKGNDDGNVYFFPHFSLPDWIILHDADEKARGKQANKLAVISEHHLTFCAWCRLKKSLQ